MSGDIILTFLGENPMEKVGDSQLKQERPVQNPEETHKTITNPGEEWYRSSICRGPKGPGEKIKNIFDESHQR